MLKEEKYLRTNRRTSRLTVDTHTHTHTHTHRERERIKQKIKNEVPYVLLL